jgi:hypothetical protein
MQVGRTERSWWLIPTVTAIVAAGAVLQVAKSAGTGPPRGCVGDLDGNEAVDGADMGLLLTAWNSSGPADLDHDGLVDGADIARRLAAALAAAAQGQAAEHRRHEGRRVSGGLQPGALSACASSCCPSKRHQVSKRGSAGAAASQASGGGQAGG